MDNAGFAEYILAEEQNAEPPIPGAAVYRELVRSGIRAQLESSLKITLELLGEEEFEKIFSAFLASGGPNTPYYRDIPGDFASWAEEEKHPLADLIHWEWLRFTALRHPADIDELPPAEGEALKPNPTMQLGIYARPVHEMDAENPDPEPYPGPMAMLIWRRPRSDELEYYPVGLLIARALAAVSASETPLTARELAEQLAGEVPGVAASDLHAALQEVCAVLRERDGLLG